MSTSVTKKTAIHFSALLKEVKTRIQQAQSKAFFAVNSELLRLYWDVGRAISEKQKKESWGSRVIPRLAKELSGQMADLKGFSERNLERMVAFYKAYSHASAFSPPAVAELDHEAKTEFESVFWSIPWTHHILLMEKIAEQETRVWYLTETLKNGWSKNTLLSMINSKADKRKGKAVSNFGRLLPPLQAERAKQELKDPYIFDFLTLQESFHERELEVKVSAPQKQEWGLITSYLTDPAGVLWHIAEHCAD